jgi:hypothetical protein
MATSIADGAEARAPIDRAWTISFIVTLFAIHIGRMEVDLTFLGLISPAVAVLGDMVIAVIFTLLVINPIYLLWRGPTRWIERRMWRWHLALARGVRARWLARITGGWLHWRMRLAIRMRAGRYSLPTALQQALQTGLPVAAILAATVPVWGMSWYFDTENWAAGMWNSWAESRTDTWREAMVRAVLATNGGVATPATFAVQPEGVGRRFLVHRDRRHRRRRRVAARAARSDPQRRQHVRRALCRRVLRRRVSDRGDEGLRSEVLAAVQGRHETGVRDSRQSRLVRRERSVQRDVSPAGRGAGEHSRQGRGRPARLEHDRTGASRS